MRIQKYADKEDFGRKGLFRADSWFSPYSLHTFVVHKTVCMNVKLDFSAFSPLNSKDWEAKICKETGVSNIEDLRVEMLDGLSFSPLHTGVENDNGGHWFRPKGDWTVVHYQAETREEKKANINIIKALEGGANGLFVEVDKSIQWSVLLNNIELSYIQLFVSANDHLAINNLRLYLSENYQNKNNEIYILKTDEKFEDFTKTIGIDGRALANAFVPAHKSIGIMLAHSYQAILDGYKPKDLWFLLGTTGDYFVDIAQVRALRALFSFLLEQIEESDLQTYIYTESITANKSPEDEYTNMLRNTTEGMGAVVGGTDALCLHPHNVLTETDDPFGQRIARNTQLVLQYEAHINKSVDPAAGSYFLENLSHSIAKSAWEFFKIIEGKGGIVEYEKSGALTHLMEQYQKRNAEDIAAKKIKRIGVNVYQKP
ncbi:MAG: hypothetical protein JJU02_07770 [Cryomorphaceae bacterium]|nr:hypothetical protein [Cryomorphaceae bacterium]